MNWKTIKKILHQLWLIHAKRSVQEVSVGGMLAKTFYREWEEYPWKVSELITFKCLSNLSDLYIVEKVVAKRYLQPDGQLKTEVEDRLEWKAFYNSSNHLLTELEGKGRLIGFLPEKLQILLGIHFYNIKR